MSSNGQDLNAKILKQIEYYFGDANLQRDKFLREEIKKDHGWVPLDVLLIFNRLKQLTTDKPTIAAALKDSEIVDVSEDGEKVRRNPTMPLPKNNRAFWQKIENFTVYIKGFPQETTLDEIMEFLNRYDAEVALVEKKDGSFVGSIFATFKDNESAENFVKNEDSKKFKDIELLRMMQIDYWLKEVPKIKERKAAEKALKNQMKNETLKLPADFIKSQVMQVSGLPTENVTFGLLKEFFNKYAPVAYAVYEQGSSEARIRFKSDDEGAATKALEKMNEAAKESDGKILFQGQEIQCKVLEGEEEVKFWSVFLKKRAKACRRQRYRLRKEQNKESLSDYGEDKAESKDHNVCFIL